MTRAVFSGHSRTVRGWWPFQEANEKIIKKETYKDFFLLNFRSRKRVVHLGTKTLSGVHEFIIVSPKRFFALEIQKHKHFNSALLHSASHLCT